jgi:hypothetical protein
VSTYIPASAWKAADKHVVAELLRAAAHFKADKVERLALIEAGIVESGLRNLSGGDRDSVGVLQQRAGWGSKAQRMDPYDAAQAFLHEARRIRTRYTLAGRLAQAVQRSAYPLRYSAASAAAKYVIRKGHREGNPVSEINGRVWEIEDFDPDRDQGDHLPEHDQEIEGDLA